MTQSAHCEIYFIQPIVQTDTLRRRNEAMCQKPHEDSEDFTLAHAGLQQPALCCLLYARGLL